MQTQEVQGEGAAALPAPGASDATLGSRKLGFWFAQGFRAAFLMKPRLGAEVPAAWQLLAMVVLVEVAQLALGRLEIAGPAGFNHQGWLASWWSIGALLLVAWSLFAGVPPAERPPSAHPIAAWAMVWLAAHLPAAALNPLLVAFNSQGQLYQVTWLAWGLFLLLWAWSVGFSYVSARTFLPGRRAAALAAVSLVLGVVSWQVLPDRTWYALEQPSEPARPRMRLSQATFETQQAVWKRSVDALAPQRPAVADVYGIVFAPYADEDVFLRESTMVSDVLAKRFDASGRVLHLVNHVSTVRTHPWATPENLQRAVEAVAQRMDKDNDLLVVYMTSHGASNFQLAAAHWPLAVDPIAPQLLREALDKAGIRHRVIAISACFSGGWVEPLADEHSLVMTAADATHTSYGCGRLSELTFFGRALWNEQLRQTHSFEQAFAAAVPLIKQREEEAGKEDGFSNPQIRVGEKIRPVLQALEARLRR